MQTRCLYMTYKGEMLNMANEYHNTDRAVLRVTGADRVSFLEGLVSNAVSRTVDSPVYAAMLSPQGKYLFDFIITSDGESLLIDVQAARAQALAQRLNMYRLRADVQIEESGLSVIQGFDAPPEGAFVDPRSDKLGWRRYSTDTAPALDVAAWDVLRVANAVPESGRELLDNDTYILEAGFEALNGVDFRKGCYVGQEVTARMKHKTELKKGLVRVSVDGVAEAGTSIMVGEKPAGTLFTVSGGEGLAYLRFDRAKEDMTADKAIIRRI